jgi:HCOMODA/2-hydroxy-3-carboxy-muconic semialdehyde decarboxylase
VGTLDGIIRDLVVANRILAHEGVLDAYGHVSVRHPSDPGRYLLSRSRSPQLVGADDILEYSLEGEAPRRKGAAQYTERHIHGAIYEARPDVQAVVHSHADEVLPFSVASAPLRPVIHTASGIGARVPVWDIRDRFGHTDLLVSKMEHGRDLAQRLAGGPVVLMRGHGFAAAARALREVVKTAVYIPRNARVLTEALRLGDVKYLSQEEIDLRFAADSRPERFDRAWEYWSLRAGVLVQSRKRR